MKLVRLIMENFKGMKFQALVLNGRSVKVRGANRTGKTTLKDAFLWLVTGKDSANRADFAVKPRDKDGNEKHNLVTAVEASLEGDGLQPLVLRKEQSEKWTKRRGSADRVYEGNEVSYFVNGVPVKKKEYDESVSTLAVPPFDLTFRSLTDTAFFCETMHHTDRRKILAAVAGVDMGEVFALENEKAKVQASLKAMKKDIDELPARIDEANKALPQEEKDKGRVALLMEAAVRRCEAADADLADIKNGGATSELRRRRADLEAQATALVRKYEDHKRVLVNEHQAKVQNLRNLIDEKRKKSAQADKELQETSKRYYRLVDELDEVGKQYDREFARVFDGKIPMTTCGRDDCPVMGAYKENWNKDHAATLKRLDDRGDEMDKQVKALADEMQKQGKEAGTMLEESIALDKDLAALGAPSEPTMDPMVKELQKQVSDLDDALENEEKAKGDLLKEAKEKKKTADDDLAALRKDMAVIEASENTRARIVDLEKKQANMAQGYADIERSLMEIEDRQRQIARSIEEKVNMKFKGVQFSLFRERINGGLEEVCDPMIDGVPYGSANNAARINAGLAIIDTLATFYEKSLPIFVDNREAVVDLYETKAQTVELIVSADHKQLDTQEV